MHETISIVVTNRYTDTHAHTHLQTTHSQHQCKGFQFLHVFFNSCVLFCFDNSFSKRCDGIISLICTSLMMGDVEHFYIHLLAICMSFFKEMFITEVPQKVNTSAIIWDLAIPLLSIYRKQLKSGSWRGMLSCSLQHYS